MDNNQTTKHEEHERLIEGNKSDKTTEHELLTFSIQGLIFLSGEWIRKSPFSLSSMNAFILR